MVADMHKDSADAPIRFPGPQGAFPEDILLRPPPVVVDANILRNDIRLACRKGQRTVPVTAANAGLIRLFCARHVHDEVIAHRGEWTATGPVTRDDSLSALGWWYLPLVRIVPIGDKHLAWVAPADAVRVRYRA